MTNFHHSHVVPTAQSFYKEDMAVLLLLMVVAAAKASRRRTSQESLSQGWARERQPRTVLLWLQGHRGNRDGVLWVTYPHSPFKYFTFKSCERIFRRQVEFLALITGLSSTPANFLLFTVINCLLPVFARKLCKQRGAQG